MEQNIGIHLHYAGSFNLWQKQLRLPAVSGERALSKRRYSAMVGFWLDHGLTTRAATVVASAGCRSLDDIRSKGWLFFLRQENCGRRTLQELSSLIGGWLDGPSRRGAWIRQLPDDILVAELRRRGIPIEQD